MDIPAAAHRRIIAGLIVFAVFAVFGLRLLYRGLRDDIYDGSGMPRAGRSWFVIGGLACLLPLFAYAVYLWKQGYFE